MSTQRIRETCSCGASVEVRLNSPALAREAVDHWRASHRHEVRDTHPVGTQDGQQAVIDPDGWVCSDCGGSPVDCGRGIHCMAERAPSPASGQQAAPIAHEGETVLFDLARMASGQAYPVTISGQRVVAVKDHQDNINFYPLNADATAERANDSPGGCKHRNYHWDGGRWVCSDCGEPVNYQARKRKAGGG